MRGEYWSGNPGGGWRVRFILNIRAELPGEWTAVQRQALARQESEHAAEFMKRGILRRIFRIVGQTANFSIWDAESPEELHRLLQTLPMFAFLKITVTPVIKHPVEQLYEEKYGATPPF
jgi:muconolactone D-isomerase